MFLDTMLNVTREIIDESDVFVDVHKAVRRMAPAPKSRVPKGRIVEEPAKAGLVEHDPSEVNGDSKPTKEAENARRRSSVEAPQPRFQLRKQYSTPNAHSGGWVTHLGTADEIREHLKHLGPSNLASRPRQTRYQNVKIKRGSSSPTRSGQTDADSGPSVSDLEPRQAPSPGYQGGIGAGILNSAGPDAKDGVHALKLGYGTMGTSQPVPSGGTNSEPGNAFPQISIPEAVTEEQEDRSRTDDQTRHNSTQESPAVSLRSSDSQTEDRTKPTTYMHRGPARSGSITEHVVDVNGIRKVVLHTTSSASSSETEGRAPSQKSKSKPNDQSVRPDDPRDDETPQSLSTNGTKKKRRRKRRGNSSKKSDSRQSDEQRPLLSS